VPQNVQELLALADLFFKAGMTPKNCNRPEAVAAVIAYGLEIGIKPAAAVNSIMVQNGRGTVWGDIPLALVRASGLLEEIEEFHDGEGEQRTAVCRVKRRGEPKFREGRYSVADARKAELFMKGGKAGPWDKDTDHMLKLRARGRLLRDVFTDVLNGLAIGEDSEESTVTVAPTANVQVTRTETNQPSANTPVVEGVPMIDDYTLQAIKELQPSWFKRHGIDANDTTAIVKWRGMLKDRYGHESATKLTQAQAEELLGAMQTCAADPTMAAMFPEVSHGDTLPPKLEPTTETNAA